MNVSMCYMMHLFYRINRLCKDAVPNNAPILYKSGAFNYKLKETDDVAELFKNKRARFRTFKSAI